jgi:hypothetical protein
MAIANLNDTILVVVIKEGVVYESFIYSDNAKAEAKFLDLAKTYKESWLLTGNILDEELKDMILEEGFVDFLNENGSICITHPEEGE